MQLTFLGITLDTMYTEAHLSADKIARIKQMTTSWLTEKCHKKGSIISYWTSTAFVLHLYYFYSIWTSTAFGLLQHFYSIVQQPHFCKQNVCYCLQSKGDGFLYEVE